MENLVDEIMALGIRAEYIAQQTGHTPNTVYTWKRGSRPITKKNREKLERLRDRTLATIAAGKRPRYARYGGSGAEVVGEGS